MTWLVVVLTGVAAVTAALAAALAVLQVARLRGELGRLRRRVGQLEHLAGGGTLPGLARFTHRGGQETAPMPALVRELDQAERLLLPVSCVAHGLGCTTCPPRFYGSWDA